MRIITVLGLCTLVACGSHEASEDAIDDPFLVGGKTDGIDATPDETAAILDVVNTMTADELARDVGLARRAAQAIALARQGADETLGTDDDVLFSTLSALDAVPYVGRSAFAKLRAFVKRTTAATFGAAATDTPMVVPAGETSGVESDIVIDRNEPITAMRVKVSITHPYVGDLFVQLRGPTITKTLQSRDIRQSGANLRYTFDVPEAVGETTHGTWTLFVTENSGAYDARIDSWSLEFDTSAPAAGKPTVFASHTPIQIPALSATGAYSTIVVKDSRVGKRATASFDIVHPWVPSLKVTLEGPDHQSKVLFDGWYDDNGSTTHLKRTVELPEWADGSMWGGWTLNVVDQDDEKQGTLNAWSLSVWY